MIPPERQDHIRKISRIFLQHSYDRRDGLPPNQRFVHYTDANAALSIIKSRSMWMRNATVMNDFSELRHGLGMLNSALFPEDSPRYRRFNEACRTCHPDAFGDAIKAFNEQWSTVSANLYICSISEHRPDENDHGRLSMWRAYGNKSARVALVLRIPGPFSAT